MSTYTRRARLYDAAFSWDISDEVEWLLGRLGAVRSLLEPACGTARMFPELDRRGVCVTGIDASAGMLELARERLAGLTQPHRLVAGDICDFELGERFDGAICPINTLGLLTTEEALAAHLACVAAHLEAGRRYLVQLDLRQLAAPELGNSDEHSEWEVDGPGGRLRCRVFASGWDPDRRIERQTVRFEILSGPRAGEVHQDEDEFLVWDWERWQALIDESPFEQAHAWDGSRAGRWPRLEPGPGLEGARLTWHELVRL